MTGLFDYNYTGPAQQYAGQAQSDNTWRSGMLSQIDQWQQGRQPQYQQMANDYQQSMDPIFSRQAVDQNRQLKNRMASQGLLQGSQHYVGQADVAQQLASNRAGAAVQGQQYADQARLSDMDMAAQLKQQASSVTPGEQLGFQALLDASRARAGLSGQMGQLALQQTQNQFQNQVDMSQLMGGQINQFGTALQTYSRMPSQQQQTQPQPAWYGQTPRQQAVTQAPVGGWAYNTSPVA